MAVDVLRELLMTRVRCRVESSRLVVQCGVAATAIELKSGLRVSARWETEVRVPTRRRTISWIVLSSRPSRSWSISVCGKPSGSSPLAGAADSAPPVQSGQSARSTSGGEMATAQLGSMQVSAGILGATNAGAAAVAEARAAALHRIHSSGTAAAAALLGPDDGPQHDSTGEEDVMGVSLSGYGPLSGVGRHPASSQHQAK